MPDTQSFIVSYSELVEIAGENYRISPYSGGSKAAATSKLLADSGENLSQNALS